MGCARAAEIAKICLIAIEDPLGDKNAGEINKLAASGDVVADVVGVVVKRVIEMSGPGASVSVARRLGEDLGIPPSEVGFGPAGFGNGSRG